MKSSKIEPVEVADKIKEALEKSNNRKFVQSVEIAINFKEVDMEKPENKVDLLVVLPKGIGKDTNIGIFAEGDTKEKAKQFTNYVFGKKEIQEVNRRKMRKVAKSCTFFLAQPELMTTIGKTWGVVLGPRSKMPQIMQPNIDFAQVIPKLKQTIRVKSKKNPTIHARIGTEKMAVEDLVENYHAVLYGLEKKIDKSKLRSIYVKTTMGKPIKIL